MAEYRVMRAEIDRLKKEHRELQCDYMTVEQERDDAIKERDSLRDELLGFHEMFKYADAMAALIEVYRSRFGQVDLMVAEAKQKRLEEATNGRDSTGN